MNSYMGCLRTVSFAILGALIGGSIAKGGGVVYASNQFPSGVTNSNGVWSGSWTFCNYDFVSAHLGSYCNQIGSDVDHPVTIIAGDNATDVKVQQAANNFIYNGQYVHGDYHKLANTSQITIDDSEPGKKTTNGCGYRSKHYRAYGTWYSSTGYVGYLVDSAWGQFLFLTTHEDVNESCAGVSTQTGFEEDAAAWLNGSWLLAYLNTSLGSSGVSYSWKWFNNELDPTHPNTTGYVGAACSDFGMNGYWTQSTQGECAQSDGYADYVHFR